MESTYLKEVGVREIYFLQRTPIEYFGHRAILKYTDRVEGLGVTTVEEMDEAIKDRWNAIVGKNDEIIVIGDVCFNNHAGYLNALNGKKTLVMGSHDKAGRNVYDNCFVKIVNRMVLKSKPHHFDINHTCLRIWDKCHYGSYHLFGHSHGRVSTYNLSMDVGIDAEIACYAPIPIETVLAEMERKKEIMQEAGRIIEENGKTLYLQDDVRYFERLLYGTEETV